jgi:hypothetical protein
LVALVFLAGRLKPDLASTFPAPRRAAIYLMGSLAAYWVIDRSANLF